MLQTLNLAGIVLSLVSGVLAFISSPKFMYGFPNGEDLKEIHAQRTWKRKLFRISFILLITGFVIAIFTHPLIVGSHPTEVKPKSDNIQAGSK